MEGNLMIDKEDYIKLAEYSEIGKTYRNFQDIRLKYISLNFVVVAGFISLTEIILKNFKNPIMLGSTGILLTITSLLFLIVDTRISSHLKRLEKRGDEIAKVLDFHLYEEVGRESTLKDIGASTCLKILYIILILLSLVWAVYNFYNI